jgi:hypothetical protein
VQRVLFLNVVRKAGSRPSLASGSVSAATWRRFVVACAAALAASAAAIPSRADVESRSIDVHGMSPSRAEVIRLHAEDLRQRISADLFGQPRPRPWHVRCEIHVHHSAAAFESAVGGPPAIARGATSIEFAGEDVSLRRIDVMGDDAGAIPDALAHELVHVVLADHFTAAPPPRWADEGIAVLYDDSAKQSGHEADFLAARRNGLAWSAEHLFAMENYPEESARQRIFYGQSAALVRWLVNRRDTATFVRFLDDCRIDGEVAALERHYGLTSIAALDREWLSGPADTDVGAD